MSYRRAPDDGFSNIDKIDGDIGGRSEIHGEGERHLSRTVRLGRSGGEPVTSADRRASQYSQRQGLQPRCGKLAGL